MIAGAVEGERDRLPDPLVVERLHVVAHRELPVRRAGRGEDGEALRVCEDRLSSDGPELVDCVDLLADEREDVGLLVLVERDLDGVERRCGPQ